MQKNIQEKLYDKYSPRVYQRREEYGGLIDEKNIVTEVNNNNIVIANITPPSPSIFNTSIRSDDPTLLTTWIDDGVISVESLNLRVTRDNAILENHFEKPSFFEETYYDLVGLDIVEDIIRDNLQKELAKTIKARWKK